MTRDLKILLAGFGGQGILFMGKVMANAGLIDGCEVSWLPSYGPEMRGGTANCSVCISDEPIGSPLCVAPEILVVMNQPSLDKFIGKVPAGGKVFMDSTLVKNNVQRDDIEIFEIPATALAEEKGLSGLANIMLIGKVWKEIEFCGKDALEAGIKKSVPASKAALVEKNLEAIEIGKNA